MNEPDEYDPISCPVNGCSYENEIRSVAGHVSGKHDTDHSWDRLGFDGSREFVMQHKRKQMEQDESESPTFDLDFATRAVVLFALVDKYNCTSLQDLNVLRLTNIYSLLSDVSRSSNTARQTVRDVLLEKIHEDRSVDSDYGSINRYTAQTRRLKDETEILDAIEKQDIEPERILSIDKHKLQTVVEQTEIDEDDVFEIESSPRIQKSDINERMCADFLKELPAEYERLIDFEQ